MSEPTVTGAVPGAGRPRPKRPIEQSTVLITGATDGLGKGVATELARQGATVLVHGRDQRRDAQAEL